MCEEKKSNSGNLLGFLSLNDFELLLLQGKSDHLKSLSLPFAFES